jgi:hypothetical protein
MLVIIPIVTENFKTHAVIDTGSTFSIITLAFQAVVGSTVTPDIGSIQLAHTHAKQLRLGHTRLNIFYNKRFFKHKFLRITKNNQR